MEKNSAHSYTEGSELHEAINKQDEMVGIDRPAISETFTPEQQAEQDRVEHELWLADPENKKKALALAEQFLDLMGNKWFTLEKCAKATKLDKLTILTKINLCAEFGLVQKRIGTYQDGPEKAGKGLFKVVISNEEKIKAIDDVIAYHKKCIEDFEIMKKGLQ